MTAGETAPKETKMKDYDKFLESKRLRVEPVGFDVDDSEINSRLFDWQRAIVRWALRRGRCALFEDCGLGKTPQQLEFGNQICKRTGGRALILTPLAVARQTQREAEKFGIQATVARCAEDVRDGINICNYEMAHHLNSSAFQCIILDESSILKSFDGTMRKFLTQFASNIKYRLCCTATPAPNDLIELTNHSEFLNVMGGKEIVALFFKQDGNTTHQWRLKKHAVDDFWKWMAEWSIALRKPSDIGYSDDGFILPELKMHQIITEGKVDPSMLFSVEANTLQERRNARRNSLEDRVRVCAELANGTDDQCLVWCDLNSESEALTKAINGSVEVKGGDSDKHKESAMLDFSDGKIRALVTKPSIAGYGMNWQNCHRAFFVGLSDSYEQFYQAIRRNWRFGQKHTVECYVITSENEGAVVANIERKDRQATDMFDNIVKHMSVHSICKKQERNEMEYIKDEQHGKSWKFMLGDSCERIKEIDTDSIGLSVFSPPFPGMYAYTNSARDIGNCKNFSELIEHFSFLMADILRITMPGRCCCVHLTQEPVFKGRDGYVGLRDFRGDCIRAMESAGWFYYSEVTIDKNPMLKASRTKEATLLFKTLAGDSTMNRPALADYIIVFKKPGDNRVPVRSGISEKYDNKSGWISQEEWCEWASPVWYRAMPKEKAEYQPFQENYPSRNQSTDGIRETDVLNVASARDGDDEKHLCPLQLGVIERCIKLWSAPGDTVFSPFGGIGSEGYMAVKLNRKAILCELKPSYWRVGCENLRLAESELSEQTLL